VPPTEAVSAIKYRNNISRLATDVFGVHVQYWMMIVAVIVVAAVVNKYAEDRSVNLDDVVPTQGWPHGWTATRNGISVGTSSTRATPSATRPIPSTAPA
jgi:hypothetical protein